MSWGRAGLVARASDVAMGSSAVATGIGSITVGASSRSSIPITTTLGTGGVWDDGLVDSINITAHEYVPPDMISIGRVDLDPDYRRRRRMETLITESKDHRSFVSRLPRDVVYLVVDILLAPTRDHLPVPVLPELRVGRGDLQYGHVNVGQVDLLLLLRRVSALEDEVKRLRAAEFICKDPLLK